MNKLSSFIHTLFIPKEENNFRAKALHPDFLSSYLVLALLLTFAFKLLGNTNVLGFATDISADKLLSLTNEERAKENLPPLVLSSALSEAAHKKAQDMFAKNYWAHFGPHGETPWNFILDAGYRYEYAGENLAKNFLFSQGVVDAWMNSPTHKANIVQPNYTEIGFAIENGVLNGEETTLVVQMFGSPLDGTVPAVEGVDAAEKTETAVVKEKPVVTSGVPHQLSRLPVLSISYRVQIIFLSFLLIALGLDLYFAFKFNVMRVAGRNIAHFIFIGFVIIGIIIITKGAIL